MFVLLLELRTRWYGPFPFLRGLYRLPVEFIKWIAAHEIIHSLVLNCLRAFEQFRYVGNFERGFAYHFVHLRRPSHAQNVPSHAANERLEVGKLSQLMRGLAGFQFGTLFFDPGNNRAQ
jgi:hypothetical protein